MPKIIASTQQHLDIEDIIDDLIILKSGGAALVLQTTAVNFDLLSELEQDALIGAYSSLLNSVSFKMQVVIRSKKMDISTYLGTLQALEERQTNPFLKDKINSYRKFIAQLVTKNEVLDKRFYVVIPYQGGLIAERTSPLAVGRKMLGLKQTQIRVDKKAVLEKATVQLAPKRDHIVKQLSRVGIKARQLTTQELIELFYDIYNPEVAREQKLRVKAGEYTAPIVEPAIEG